MKWLAVWVAAFFIVALVAPLGFMLWGLLVGNAVAVAVSALLFGIGGVCAVPFVWAISGGNNAEC